MQSIVATNEDQQCLVCSLTASRRPQPIDDQICCRGRREAALALSVRRLVRQALIAHILPKSLKAVQEAGGLQVFQANLNLLHQAGKLRVGVT